MIKKISSPLSVESVKSLKAGDIVHLSGVIYTARDAAHKKLTELVQSGSSAGIDFAGAVIYYCGPTPAKPGQVIGSAGPTTSGRMDAYTPYLMEQLGFLGMIGKGKRSQPVIESIKKHFGVYFAAVGGAGALISKKIIKAEAVLFEELGAEAVYRLEVLDFPLIVAIDSDGNDICR